MIEDVQKGFRLQNILLFFNIMINCRKIVYCVLQFIMNFYHVTSSKIAKAFNAFGIFTKMALSAIPKRRTISLYKTVENRLEHH